MGEVCSCGHPRSCHEAGTGTCLVAVLGETVRAGSICPCPHWKVLSGCDNVTMSFGAPDGMELPGALGEGPP
jgi:hypothetical protein